MARTWGGVDGSFGLTANVTFGATARASLICGWWYPTTLTAGRKLFGAGATWGAEINTTTSELRLRTDNTTDGQWTTTGVGLALDTWTFVAVMNSTLNTGPASAWRVWSGTVETAPQECTVSVATSPTGNFTGNATLTIGNSSAATVGWQGSIGSVSVITSQAAAGATTNPLFVATHGTISAEAAALVYERYVVPYWLGQDPPIHGNWLTTEVFYMPLQPALFTGSGMQVAYRRSSSAATGQPTAMTNTNTQNDGLGVPRPDMSTRDGLNPQPIRR